MAGVPFSGNHTLSGDVAFLPSFPVWQLLVMTGVIVWICLARFSLITLRLRSVLQPFVAKHVEDSVPFMLWVQRIHNPTLDVILASLSYCVSVEFYTAFLPLLFWSGHSRLARHMTLLMAFCLYLGNCMKDVVSAPRPPSPPVRKLLATDTEKESAQEYGLPSSHTINTLCLAGYLLHYIGTNWGERSTFSFWLLASFFGLLMLGVVYGRLYLGMHSPVDIVVGAVMGFSILYIWIAIENYVEAFVTHGENVISFWAAMAVLLLFAYPSPAQRNPSFEFHTAFNGVALGVVSGIHRTFHLYHDGGVLTLSMTSRGSTFLLLRLLMGLPVCLAVKAASKALAIKMLPSICNVLGLQIQSSGYVQAVHVPEISLKAKKKDTGGVPKKVEAKKSGLIPKILQALDDEVLDVDTGIRLLQYAGLGWSVVELAPCIFSHLNL